ncbi:dihydroorotase [Pokkaliibacter sp. CJK22405]|uniref:dihydroorotase n=1 Tax=Pokkaliibacter sp. CJK22405 TaxID=3384615 RepID=UPI003985584A
MSMKILIKGGRLIDPANHVDDILDIYVQDGVIASLDEPIPGFEPDLTLDATGKVVSPGFIDLSASMREPGFTHKGTLRSETLAAAAGGVTTLCCPPDSNPVNDSTAVTKLIMDKARQAGFSKVLPIGAMTRNLDGEHLANMQGLSDIGCIAVSNGRYPVRNSLTLMRCLEYAATFDLLVIFQSEDPDLSNAGVMHDGANALRFGLAGIPETAETIAVARDLLLIEQTGVRAHFSQLSTARAAQLIMDARAKGLRVTADVAVHHLLYTDAKINGFNSAYHVNPPLRSAIDRAGLREAILGGTLSAICSDHQPHDEAAKRAPFGATETGISGIETLLAQALHLVHQDVLSLEQLIDKLSVGPARVLGLPLGQLGTGAVADICIFDPEEEWTVTEESLYSAGKNSPLIGETVKGRVVYTLVDGELVYQAR